MTVRDTIKTHAPNTVRAVQRLRRRFGADIHQDVPPWLLEHIARYQWANFYVGGKAVLDAACGSGYGSALLDNAAAYVGVDLDRRAVDAACRYYPKAHFRMGSVYDLSNLRADVVVSFETLEHVEEPPRALAEFFRVAPTVIGSIPINHPEEVFHVRKWTGAEVVDLLAGRLVVWAAQRGSHSVQGIEPWEAEAMTTGTLLFRAQR